LIIAIIDIYLELLPLLIFLIYLRQSRSETGILLIAAYSTIIFLINFVMLHWSKIPLLYDSFTLIECLFFCAFLHSQLKNKNSKKILRLSCAVFTVCYIAFTIYTKSATDTSSIPTNQVVMDSIPIGVETILLLSFSFYFLYERTKDTTTLFIYNTYQFWVILGIVLYLAGSFFIYIFCNYLSPSEVRKYWVVTNCFSILRSLFFVLAIIYNSKPPRNNTLIPDFEMSYLN
jgi:hypothetical protein